MTTDEFKEFLKEKRAFYKGIGEVQCPILNEVVVFNSKGFYHLRYDGHSKERVVKEQIYKISLLSLVVPVVKNATSIYEYKKQEYSKPLGKYYEIWELRMLVGKKNPVLISVVLRRIGNGKVTFLSVWKNKENKHR